MAKRTRYHDWLIRNLADPAEAEGYLNAVLLDYPEGLAKAIRNVAEARALALTETREGETDVRRAAAREDESVQALQSALHKMGLRLTVARESDGTASAAGAPQAA